MAIANAHRIPLAVLVIRASPCEIRLGGACSAFYQSQATVFDRGRAIERDLLDEALVWESMGSIAPHRIGWKQKRGSIVEAPALSEGRGGR